MTTKQLVILNIAIGLVLLGLIVELSDNHVTKADIAVTVAFLSGVGIVLAFNKAGKN